MNTPVAGVVTSLSTARRALQLYPSTHPAYAEAVNDLVERVGAACTAGPIVLNWHQGRLYHGSEVLGDDITGAAAVAESFESRGIESLSFAPSFGDSDAVGLMAVLSLKPAPELDVARELADRGVAGVTVSVIADAETDGAAERDRQREADRALYHRIIANLRRMQESLAGGGSGELAQSSELVESVMERLMADPGAMLGLATIRGTSERNLFHSLNVTIYSLLLGHRLGLPAEGLSSLGVSALLHDVGKAAFDPADPGQAAPMRSRHPEIGAHILQRAGLDDPAPMLVSYEHHMCADGSGWPEHPDGYTAHPFSRMVAIANRYHNLTDPDDGNSAVTPDKAVVQLMREAGGRLDPVFVRLFVSALGVFPVGCLVRLSDHSVGVVARPGEDPLTPVVRLAFDVSGAELPKGPELDLACSDAHIVEVVEPEALDLVVADTL